MTSLPPAAKRALIAKGLMDDQGVTARPRQRHCRRCGAAVIAALADTLTVAVHPTPTTVAGELAALLAGARTYQVWGSSMSYRDHWVIRAAVNHPDVVDVHVAHSCGMAAPEANPKRMRSSLTRKVVNGRPHFFDRNGRDVYADIPF